MAELKTKRNKASVLQFLKSIDNPRRQKDALELLAMFKEVTGLKAEMWGDSIVGFGSYHYKSTRSSQEGDWPLTGFSPRKQNLSVYIMPGFKKYQNLLASLGKHKHSVSCLYINKLVDIDLRILKKIIKQSVADMKKKYK